MRDASVLCGVQEAIEQIEVAETLRELPYVTNLSGASAFCGLRVGDYRVGIAVAGEQLLGFG